jgi:polyhydroxyalkanoate synthesis regulator phasin
MNSSPFDTTPTPETDTAIDTVTRPSRKGLAFGLTAGLLGGTVAGMAFGIPGLTSAAADDGADTAPAALVQQADDETTVADTDTEAEVPAERGERLRESLQPLVDDGTITSDQADAVATHLVENRPEREGHGRGGHGRFARGVSSEVITDLLGIDGPTLRTELRDGATLAEIAEANGVEPAAVVDALVAEAEERVDAAVEAGRIDADEAAERLADIEARVTAKVNGDEPTDG